MSRHTRRGLTRIPAPPPRAQACGPDRNRPLARTSPGPAIRAALLLLGALGLHNPSAAAQDTVPRADRITLQNALQRAEASSLELRLAREGVAAAQTRVVTAGTRPNPTLGIDREQLGGDGGDYETVLTVGCAGASEASGALETNLYPR